MQTFFFKNDYWYGLKVVVGDVKLHLDMLLSYAGLYFYDIMKGAEIT